MARLDIDKQNKLEPKRIEHAAHKLISLGYDVKQTGVVLQFQHNGETIRFYPYSGWHTGKGIKDGRGLKNLINQLKNK